MARWFWRRQKIEEKFITRTTTTNDNNNKDAIRLEKRTFPFGSGELKMDHIYMHMQSHKTGKQDINLCFALQKLQQLCDY